MQSKSSMKCRFDLRVAVEDVGRLFIIPHRMNRTCGYWVIAFTCDFTQKKLIKRTIKTHFGRA